MNLKKLAATAAVATLIPFTAACSSDGNTTAGGGGDTGAYCTALKNMQSMGEGFSPGDATDAETIDKLLPEFKKIEAAAPAEVKKEWGQVITVLEKVKARDVANLATEAKDMAEGMRKVGTHAQEKCGVSMN